MCPTCNIATRGTEIPLKKSDGTVVLECQWRCKKCGHYMKKGIISETPPKS